MSSTVPATTARRATVPARIGLVIAGLLAGGDIAVSAGELGEFLLQPLALIVLGVATLIAIPFTWLGAAWARTTVIVTRVVAALTTVPAFFSAELPAAAVGVAAAWVILTLVVAVLLLAPPRSAR